MELREERPHEGGRAWPRHLEVQARRIPEREAEVRASAARAVGLEGQADPSILEEEVGDVELGTDVVEGLGVGRNPDLLADLVAMRLDEGSEAPGGREPGRKLDVERVIVAN